MCVEMSCLVYGGDPPSCDGIAGCKFAHPPGMLCREQRTALTTRVRSESKKDMGQLALRLQIPSSLVNLSQKIMDERWKSPSPRCDRSNSFIFPSHLCLESLSPRKHSYASNTLISENVLDSCNKKLERAENLPESDIRPRAASISWRRSSHRFFIAPKLSEVFVWLCLLGLLYPTCTKGAPITRRSALVKMEDNGHPLWVNPCGVDNTAVEIPLDAEYVSDKELKGQIVLQARNALSELNSFKEDYAKRTFNMDIAQLHQLWIETRYGWLPTLEQIPKRLDENVAQDHLGEVTKNINQPLINVYNYLQKYAVGLEQVTSDQKTNDGPFKDFFSSILYRLRAVLCEIEVAIVERNLVHLPDVKRDIMADTYRNLASATERDVRDWVILRDYMNALQYIVEIFTAP